MGRQALKIGGVLIGMYLLAAHYTGWGKLMTSAGTAGGGIIKNLQGR